MGIGKDVRVDIRCGYCKSVIGYAFDYNGMVLIKIGVFLGRAVFGFCNICYSQFYFDARKVKSNHSYKLSDTNS